MYRTPNNTYEIPTTRKPLGIGLQMLGSIEDAITKWEIDLSEKADSLMKALDSSSNPVALLKTFFQEMGTIGQHDFYKRASKYLLEYVDTDEFDRAFAYTGLEEFNLNVTKQLHDKPLGRLYIFLKEHKQVGLGFLPGTDTLLSSMSPNYTSTINLIDNKTNTIDSIPKPIENKQTSSSSGAWDSWGKDVFGGLTDLLKVGVQSTGNILTGVGNLNIAKSAQDSVNVARENVLNQQNYYNQLLEQNKAANASNNQAAIQQSNAELEAAKSKLAIYAQQAEKTKNDTDAVLQGLLTQKNNGNTDPNLLSAINKLESIQSNLKTDTAYNTALQQYTNPNFSNVNSGNSGTNWTKIALIIAGGVLVVGGVMIYLVTRKRGTGLKGVDDVSTSSTPALGSASHKKRKSYKTKKHRALSLQGIDLGGVELKS